MMFEIIIPLPVQNRYTEKTFTKNCSELVSE